MTKATTNGRRTGRKRTRRTTNTTAVRQGRVQKRAKRSARQRPPTMALDRRANGWLRLLADPCAGELTQPCYTGSDAGYLVRTLDYISLGGNSAGLTVGAIVLSQACLQFVPYNVSATSGLLWVVQTVGGGPVTPTLQGFSNFVGNTATVKRYRPVAACLKWVPTGPYSTRSGVVGLGYNSGQVFAASDSVNGAQLLPTVQHSSPNGSEPHEVRWLPTQTDEPFTTQATPNSTSAGTVFLQLYNVDATATSANTFSLNGFVEITVVWEWEPTTTGTGITTAPRAPLPFTSQSVLAKIGDMGAFLFKGALKAYGGGIVSAGVAMVDEVLSRGVGQSKYNGSGM